jgi:hypothetical protein
VQLYKHNPQGGLTMSIADLLHALKMELMQNAIPQLVDLVAAAVADEQPVHGLELDLWTAILKIGRQSLQTFFDAHGTGDLGDKVTLSDGREIHRLEELHSRRYVSIFGEFKLPRTVYGSREGQAIKFVPLDNRLQLPASVFSHVLQDWDQSLAVEQAFTQVNRTIERMLNLKQSVDSLEEMNRQMSQYVGWFRDLQGTPAAAEEGEIVVVSADQKGIVIRGQGTPTVCGGERPGGQRANQKKMATVGAVYTVDPYVRTPAEVVAALFRDQDQQRRPRPKPCHKRVWASLPQEGPQPKNSIQAVFVWLWWEFAQRNPKLQRPAVSICDGQEALWDACAEYLPDVNLLEILDLLHVTPRLWAAAKLFYGGKHEVVLTSVRHWVTQVLEGKVETVIRSMRRLGTKLGLGGAKKKSLGTIIGYLNKNRHRMRYDEYLRKGYPIASGIIEGACRHLIKDRMERAGMHWTMQGAQAMLDVRSVWIGDQWSAFQQQRIDREAEQLYPHRGLVAGEKYFAQAA